MLEIDRPVPVTMICPQDASVADLDDSLAGLRRLRWYRLHPCPRCSQEDIFCLDSGLSVAALGRVLCGSCLGEDGVRVVVWQAQ